MNYVAGSEWRKWDLHFHTPSSYDYQNGSISDQDIIDELVKNKISVVAITDHHVIDVERIRNLQKLGEGKVTVLPGIEFLSDSRGDDPVHFIAIFAEDCNLEHIWGQIKNKTNISKIEGERQKINAVYCHLLDTIQLIKELGGITTIHAGTKNCGIENITNSLPHATAQKKDIALAIDIFEMGREKDQDVYRKYVFPSIEKKIPMILCSDNHNISKYVLKSYCWIKADPNFNGLKQAIHEPEIRFYIGNNPSKLDEYNKNKSIYLHKIKIYRSNESYTPEWFSTELPLNSGLIAIIGNKGSGKSALGDIIGLAGNSTKESQFSFLNSERFRKAPLKIAQNFTVDLTWGDGRIVSKNLNENVLSTDIEQVQYLPQKFIETVCNDLGDEFKKEINRIVFSYLPEEDRLQKESFDELIKNRCKGIDENIQEICCSELEEINNRIIRLEKYSEPDYLETLKKQLTLNQQKLEALKKDKPKDVVNPVEEIELPITLIDHIVNIQLEIDNYQCGLNNITSHIGIIDDAFNRIALIKEKIRDFEIGIKTQLSRIEIEIPSVSFDCDKLYESLKNKRQELYEEQLKLKILLNKDGENDQSLYFRMNDFIKQQDELSQKMTIEEQVYQKYTENVAIWEKQVKILVEEQRDLEVDIDYVNFLLTSDLNDAYKNRIKVTQKIYNLKQKESEVYKQIYAPVLDYIKKASAKKESEEEIQEEVLNFSVIKKLKNDFTNNFLEYINRSITSDFRGLKDGQQKLIDIINKYDFNEESEIYLFIDEIYQSITKDLAKTDNIVKKRLELYNFLFGLEYLEVLYELKLGNSKLEQLSPGEKGALLLIFYLFLDKSQLPLVIDQPEDNLDNYSVFNRLVPHIRSAKERRQVIIVTHNPNLAIACDAEQIIYAKMDKQNSKISYESGSIENPVINKYIVDVLEGTMPAFTLRRIKYLE